MKILETKRLFLRVFKESDIDALHQDIFSDKEVMKYAFLGKTLTLAETREFIENYFYDNESNLGLAPIILKETQEIIGIGGITQCNYLGSDDFEFGYILKQSMWGKGYATEIAKGQIDFAFKTLELDRLLALTNIHNSRSIRVLEKLGMTYLKNIQTKNRGERRVYSIEAS